MTAVDPALASERPLRVAVVANPATRRDARLVLRAIRAEAPAETEIDAVLSRFPGEASVLARAAAERADLIVAVGGDGTVADVASGMLDSGVPLGIIPAGSTNIIARELRIPNRTTAAARLLFGRHRLAHLDVGRCGDRSFLHMAGAGLDSHFFHQTDPALKRRLGWLAYLPAGLAALRLPPSRFEIVADGEAISAVSSLVLVANGGSVISPLLRLHPEIRHDDGWLDLLIFEATTPPQIAATIALLAAGSLHRSPHLRWSRARRVEIDAHPQLRLELDGDVVAETPATISISPGALPVVAPA